MRPIIGNRIALYDFGFLSFSHTKRLESLEPLDAIHFQVTIVVIEVLPMRMTLSSPRISSITCCEEIHTNDNLFYVIHCSQRYLLLESSKEDADIKLIDVGLARTHKAGDLIL